MSEEKKNKAPEAAPLEGLDEKYNYDENACSPEFGADGCILPGDEAADDAANQAK